MNNDPAPPLSTLPMHMGCKAVLWPWEGSMLSLLAEEQELSGGRDSRRAFWGGARFVDNCVFLLRFLCLSSLTSFGGCALDPAGCSGLNLFLKLAMHPCCHR